MNQPSNNKIPCTVEILTYNSEKNILRALASVKDFAEIIIIDGGSTDKTLERARSFGCIVLPQEQRFKNENGQIKDFSGVRNQGFNSATYDWFAFVDSDEYFTEDLVNEIRGIVEKNEACAFWVPRKYVIGGEIIDQANTYPSRQMRFFNRKVSDGFVKQVHERVQLKPGTQPKILKKFMCVPSDVPASELRKKQSRYITLDVERSGNISFWRYVKISARYIALIVLYSFRTVRNRLFCRGKHMPLSLDFNVIVYHWFVMLAFSKKVRIANFPFVFFVRYFISGVSAAIVDFTFLFVLTEFFNVWYIWSASIAFGVAFCVSFVLQKFWTFKDNEKSKIKWQLPAHLSLGTVNLCINGFLVFFFVEALGVWYMLAQFLVTALLAVESFFVYRVIFKK
ncbi:MAG: GtrA family protein [Candidatus Paceibacterota bacterium]|jgi:glycosyltransferase involved in cell wall biosynthesis